MGRALIPQIDRKKVAAGTILIGGAAATPVGGVAADIALGLADYATDTAINIKNGVQAMSENPILSSQCLAIGMASPLNNPLKFYAGIDVDPPEGWATKGLVSQFNLTRAELNSSACQAAMTTGQVATTLAAGAATTRVGMAMARDLGIKALPRAKTAVGRAFQTTGEIAVGVGLNYAGAHAVKDMISHGDESSPLPPMPVAP